MGDEEEVGNLGGGGREGEGGEEEVRGGSGRFGRAGAVLDGRVGINLDTR